MIKFLIIILSIVYVKSKRELEVKEDFTANVDYRLEQSNQNWRKRGNLQFIQKNANKNYKSTVNIINEPITNEQIEEIKLECSNGSGLYYIRIRFGGNFYFSQVNSCELIKNNLNDRFIINHFGPIKSDQILSVSYDIDNKYIPTFGKDDNKGFQTSIDFVDSFNSLGPIFPEEKESPKNGQPQQEQSFFKKYWWIIMIVMFMMLIKGPMPEEGSSGAAQQ